MSAPAVPPLDALDPLDLVLHAPAGRVRAAYPGMRHMANLESVMTYEGTGEVHTLVIGHELTGLRAFA